MGNLTDVVRRTPQRESAYNLFSVCMPNFKSEALPNMGSSRSATVDQNFAQPQATSIDSQNDDQSTDGSNSMPNSLYFSSRSPQSSAASSIPPRADEWDRTLRHISLKDFGKALEKAARAVSPNGNGSKYSQVYVLMISWQTEDPKLPVDRDGSTSGST
jgi:hypothetical protein